MNAEHDLSILSSFLRRMAPEVEGHDQGDPPEDIRARLEAFAAGRAEAGERAALASLLKENPGWIRHLGRAIRGRAG